jgi:hypothetical protein
MSGISAMGRQYSFCCFKGNDVECPYFTSSNHIIKISAHGNINKTLTTTTPSKTTLIAICSLKHTFDTTQTQDRFLPYEHISLKSHRYDREWDNLGISGGCSMKLHLPSLQHKNRTFGRIKPMSYRSAINTYARSVTAHLNLSKESSIALFPNLNPNKTNPPISPKSPYLTFLDTQEYSKETVQFSNLINFEFLHSLPVLLQR